MKRIRWTWYSQLTWYGQFMVMWVLVCTAGIVLCLVGMLIVDNIYADTLRQEPIVTCPPAATEPWATIPTSGTIGFPGVDATATPTPDPSPEEKL